jgi:hypothetical protein
LSLPIANSQKAVQGDDDKPATTKTTSKESDSRLKVEESNFNFGMAQLTPAASPMMSAASFQGSNPIPIPNTVNNNGWAIPGVSRTHSYDDTLSFKRQRQSKPAPLQRTMSYSPGSFDEGIFSAPSTASVSNFSENDFPSPQELPPTPPEMACHEPFINGSNGMDIFLGGDNDSMLPGSGFAVEVSQGLQLHNDMAMTFNLDNLDTQCLNIYSTSTPVNTVSAPVMASPTFANDFGMVAGSPVFSDSNTPTVTVTETETPMGSSLSNNNSMAASPRQVEWAAPASTPTASTHYALPAGPGLSNLSPRTAYLVDYYSNSICPVLVAVDGPNNPYRVHILALAAASGPALVNGVAALASNVLHHRNTKASGSPTPSGSKLRGVSEEALHYKAASVNLYNAALRDPAAAYDDSILATLVVLSLLEISESGSVSGLKSQMAEIRQILTLRGSNSSQFLHWATMFFTWLDVMKATVGDREKQVRGGALDLLDFSANLGALEHLSFCEGRMFKVLARMGKNTRARRASESVYTVASQWGMHQGMMESPSRRPSINPFTGMPMTTPMNSSDGVPTLDSIAGSAPTPQSISTAIAAAAAAGKSPRPSGADSRQEFWSEWAHVRSRLRLWSARDASGSCTPAHPPSTSPNVSSAEPSESTLVSHASEVFRHASLLFAERLAFPMLDSRSSQIQALVSAALHHLSSIPLYDSAGTPGLNKVLLWPLCIIGTECIRPGDRDVIRLRCGESMREQGVFAGMSGMEVLERVWAMEDSDMKMGIAELNSGSVPEDSDGMPLLSSLGGQAGRWRRAMSLGLNVVSPMPVSMSMDMGVGLSSSPGMVSTGWQMSDLAAFC